MIEKDLLWLLQQPESDGLSIHNTLEQVCVLHNIENAAYFHIGHKSDELLLLGGFPDNYEKHLNSQIVSSINHYGIKNAL